MIVSTIDNANLSIHMEEIHMSNQENTAKEETGCCNSEAAKKEQQAVAEQQKEEGSCSKGGCGCG